MSAKKCIKSGYMFRFSGKRRWRASKSDLWEIIVRDETCGQLVGYRNIDGSRHVVIRKGKMYYAALPHAVK
jgi:hypothetical protein